MSLDQIGWKIYYGKVLEMQRLMVEKTFGNRLVLCIFLVTIDKDRTLEVKGYGKERRKGRTCFRPTQSTWLDRQSHYVMHAKAGAGKSADSPLLLLWV